MTVSINDDKDTITITSSLLETPWSGISSVTLTVLQDCTTEKVLTIEEGDITGSGSYAFDEDDTNFSFIQGMYSLRLKVTNSDDSIDYEYYCYFLDIDLSCRVKSVVANTEYTKNEKLYIMMLYHQLTQTNICHKASCSDYCTIFNELDNELSMLSC